jgi:hypothetical protein
MKDSGKIKLGELANDTERLLAIIMEQDRRIAKTKWAIEQEYKKARKLELDPNIIMETRVIYSFVAEAYKKSLDFMSGNFAAEEPEEDRHAIH